MKEFFKYLWWCLCDYWDAWGLLTILVIILVIAVVAGIVDTVKKQEAWEKFANEHNCRLIEVKESSASYGCGFTTNGRTGFGTIIESEKRCYVCDDSVKYWR